MFGGIHCKAVNHCDVRTAEQRLFNDIETHFKLLHPNLLLTLNQVFILKFNDKL